MEHTFKFSFERKIIYQFRILYPVKIPFKNAGEIKTFSDIQKLKEFQEILKDLQAEGEMVPEKRALQRCGEHLTGQHMSV